MNYTLTLSQCHHWDVTAAPERHWWLKTISTLFTLTPGEITDSGSIIISPLLPDDPNRSDDWQVFGNQYGTVAINIKRKRIEIGTPDEGSNDPGYLSGEIKLLVAGISLQLLSAGCLFLHAATLVLGEHAVLIVVSSGGGKSTSPGRVSNPWSAPGDENCLVIPDGQGRFFVTVLPTASKIATGEGGLSWNTTIAYPLKAICILKQSDTDMIEPMELSKAAVCVIDSFRQATRYQLILMDKMFRKEILMTSFGNASDLVRVVPTCLLRTTMTGEFWKDIERAFF
ncbi:MAG: hypothetical protein V1862_02740 [Methanobacteriota archaeon]